MKNKTPIYIIGLVLVISLLVIGAKMGGYFDITNPTCNSNALITISEKTFNPTTTSKGTLFLKAIIGTKGECVQANIVKGSDKLDFTSQKLKIDEDISINFKLKESTQSFQLSPEKSPVYFIRIYEYDSNIFSSNDRTQYCSEKIGKGAGNIVYTEYYFKSTLDRWIRCYVKEQAGYFNSLNGIGQRDFKVEMSVNNNVPIVFTANNRNQELISGQVAARYTGQSSFLNTFDAPSSYYGFWGYTYDKEAFERTTPSTILSQTSLKRTLQKANNYVDIKTEFSIFNSLPADTNIVMSPKGVDSSNYLNVDKTKTILSSVNTYNEFVKGALSEDSINQGFIQKADFVKDASSTEFLKVYFSEDAGVSYPEFELKLTGVNYLKILEPQTKPDITCPSKATLESGSMSTQTLTVKNNGDSGSAIIETNCPSSIKINQPEIFLNNGETKQTTFSFGQNTFNDILTGTCKISVKDGTYFSSNTDSCNFDYVVNPKKNPCDASGAKIFSCTNDKLISCDGKATTCEFGCEYYQITEGLTARCKGKTMPEVCDNNIDDDGDGLIDMKDSDCNKPNPSTFLLILSLIFGGVATFYSMPLVSRIPKKNKWIRPIVYVVIFIVATILAALIIKYVMTQIKSLFTFNWWS